MNENEKTEQEPTGQRRTLSPAFLNQITVLKSLYGETFTPEDPKLLQIDQISEASGLNDEREVQRYLYILEGQKLVTPYPEGDFTSKTWHITKIGAKLVRTIAKSAMN